MMTSGTLALVVTAWSVLGPAPARSQADPQVATVASYPSPAFLENLSVGPGRPSGHFWVSGRAPSD